MQVVYPRCCGIDVHKKGVTVCVLISHENGTVERQLRSFGTMTGQLQALSEWLRQWQVTHLAIESTGVYVRRITARAIPPTGRTGSEGDPWVND
jgi:transposase